MSQTAIPCQEGAQRRGGGKDAPGLAEVSAAPGHLVEPAICERGRLLTGLTIFFRGGETLRRTI
jgi:hypothetical protein